MMDLEPCYNFESQTACASLIQNLPCSFTLGNEEFNCQAEIVLDSDCSMDIKTEIPLDLYGYFSFISSMSSIKSIILNGTKIPAFVSQVSPSSSGKAIITFSPNEEPVPLLGSDETRLSKVIFHLFDFKDRKGTSCKVIRSENSAYTLGITELTSTKWKVELHETKNTEKSNSRKNGNSILTHVCSLSRADGLEFDGKAARQMMLDLRLFFTFSQGAFCPPVMPVGYDANEKRVWAVGLSPHHPDSSMSWFDPYHSEQLALLFPNFMSRLEDERWRETFHTVIYWYARSNNTSGSGIDTGIILTQIAIERLAYEYSIDCQKTETSSSFSELKAAADRLRYLFSHLDIPQEIPRNFIKIRELAAQEGFIDAPHFLTALRNSMVHPDNKRRNLFTGLYPDAWRLGMWYLELVLLRLCNYDGTYANRLSDEHWVGEVEDLPWTKKPSE
jgi:hypothetical protein